MENDTQDLIGKAHRIEEAALLTVLVMTFCVLSYAVVNIVQLGLQLGAFE